MTIIYHVLNRLEDMVQEMAKQHLNIETQLSKRGKRIMAKGKFSSLFRSIPFFYEFRQINICISIISKRYY